MGANQSSISSSDSSSPTEVAPVPDYAVDQQLLGGSGRMMRTYRMIHKPSGRSVVAKTVWIKKDDREEVSKKEKDLIILRNKLWDCRNCVAPFLEWHMSNENRPYSGDMLQVTLIRPHVYSTLKDRLESRPFLTDIEKKWILKQVLAALEAIHSRGVVHGYLLTENIGLTSWNQVVLLDMSRTYKAITQLPDDDPSLYLYYFESKACYLAPERFYTPKTQQSELDGKPLTPAMDIFSAGCVFLETSLNGERAMDLGDIIDYRRLGRMPPQLEQRLQKIDSSSLRAACRHMIGLEGRLTANEYLERLDLPDSFDVLSELLGSLQQCTSQDDRLARCALFYSKVVRATMGVQDQIGSTFMAKAVGRALWQTVEVPYYDQSQATVSQEKHVSKGDSLMDETDALLRKLDSLTLDDLDDYRVWEDERKVEQKKQSDQGFEPSETTIQDKESVQVFTQFVLSDIRYAQRPSSKLVSLQMLRRLSSFSSDEARLQRMIPSTITLLQDQSPSVRSMALETMCEILQRLKSFPPSDSKVFPQYILKRVAQMMNDSSLIVRVSFAKCIAPLAEISQRFLDIAYAVKLYEAMGGASSPSDMRRSNSASFFDDDAAKLLGGSVEDPTDDKAVATSKSTVLISNTYHPELVVLQETISRWVMHVTTDQSNQSSPPKRALLMGDSLTRLCNFFGREGVMAFLLPQILAFLNDRRDWQLRAAVFGSLTSVCNVIGRGATEHFVLPILESALVDAEDLVISHALECLSKLVGMGLLSRSVLVDSKVKESGRSRSGLFQKYGPLLLYPSPTVRQSMVKFTFITCQTLGYPDADVFLLPIIRAFLKYDVSFSRLRSVDELDFCVIGSWEPERLQAEMSRSIKKPIISPSGIQWTSVESARQVEDTAIEVEFGAILGGKDESGLVEDTSIGGKTMDPVEAAMHDFIQMLTRGRMRTSASTEGDHVDAIEGSLKLSQQVRFPRQLVAGHLQDAKSTGSPVKAGNIRSVDVLTEVYGLSFLTATGAVVNQHEPTEETLVEPDGVGGALLPISDGVTRGEWGSECTLDPALSDAVVMASKLEGLSVPQLPPRLGVVTSQLGRDPTGTNEWRPKVDALVASSPSGAGQSAPVSRLAVSFDQRFFVSGSYDGSCKVWMLEQLENTSGILSSTSRHDLVDAGGGASRVMDLAMLEHSHSFVAGTNNGTVHVARVELMESSASTGTSGNQGKKGSYSIAGVSEVKRVHPDEGEILATAHFNNLSESVIAFGTQKALHGWDLRTECEPFNLYHAPELGYITSMGLGHDRNWLVTGTSRGFLALWDIRFQRMVKLWRHDSFLPVNRIATAYSSFSLASLGSRVTGNTKPRPFAFLSSGHNECSMFDLVDGSCRQSFKVLDASQYLGRKDSKAELPILEPVRLLYSSRGRIRPSLGRYESGVETFPIRGPSIYTLVGSVGGFEQNYLITGGSDCSIRYWDFIQPSKCFNISGQLQQKPAYDRVDFQATGRMMICKQAPAPKLGEIDGSKMPRFTHRGISRPETRHTDAVLDLKLIQLPKRALVSSSSDGTVKVWR